MVLEVVLLLLNSLNHKHLKYFSNIYFVVTNSSKDQDIRASHKTINSSMLLSFFSIDLLSSCSRVTSCVHDFGSFTVK